MIEMFLIWMRFQLITLHIGAFRNKNTIVTD
ncbi:hypothetical protein VINI7043_27245 [Vibrio nigripulchritudo ATCC 27043]|nr:hypothetical protein VINI7043_27245 [Vibrio nigripulchritudo ATCC 27043]